MTPLVWQIITAAGLAACSATVLSWVRKEVISDKYGIGWVLFLCGLFIFDVNAAAWFAKLSPAFAGLCLFFSFALIVFGIVLSRQLTVYSNIRRQSVQEVALLRFHVQELEKGRPQTQTPAAGRSAL